LLAGRFLAFAELAFFGLLDVALALGLLRDELALRFFAAAFVSAIGSLLLVVGFPAGPIKCPDPVNPKRARSGNRAPPGRSALGTPSGGLPITLPG
jgi:hypothetical protein